MGICMDEGFLFIISEFMEKGSVAGLLRPKEGVCTLSFRRKMTFAKQTAQGMSWLHQMKPSILHLDLKPENLLVDENWIVKVADFGFSQLKLQSNSENQCGSPAYMSPEMVSFNSDPKINEIWGFFFELIFLSFFPL